MSVMEVSLAYLELSSDICSFSMLLFQHCLKHYYTFNRVFYAALFIDYHFSAF